MCSPLTACRLVMRYHRNMKAGDAVRTGLWALALPRVGHVVRRRRRTRHRGPTPADATSSPQASSEASTVAPTTSATIASTPTTTTTIGSTTTTTAATTTTEPEIVIPDGILAAMPTQNRVDPAKGQFQVKIFNRTDERFTVVGVQFVWEGYTTPVTDRHDIVVSGQRIDFPVKFPGASCVGDGVHATMPDPAAAHGAARPRRRQRAHRPRVRRRPSRPAAVPRGLRAADDRAQVAIELVDLYAVEFEGRPVTEGSLRLTRRASTSTVSVQTVSNNILFVFAAPEAPTDGPVVTLDEGLGELSAPVRFAESRCDPHAISEASQPFKFVAQIDLGDGVVHPYILSPPVEAQIPMRQTMEAGCEALGKIVFAGEE